MSGPTTPCVSCNKATPLGSNTINHYGELGDLCATCSHPRLSVPCNSCGARVGERCRTRSGYVTMRHASRRKATPLFGGDA